MEQSTPKRSRRFAPLNPEKASKSNAPKLKGIVFDVDGTLWYDLIFINMMVGFTYESA